MSRNAFLSCFLRPNARRLTVLLIGTLILEVAPMASAESYLVGTNSENRVSIFDADLNELVGSIPLVWPREVALSADCSTAYVSNDAGVSVIDLESRTIVDTVPVTGVWGMAVTPDGGSLYMAHHRWWGEGGITVMDTESNAVTNRIDTIGDSGSTHIAFTPDGSRAYATGSEPGDSTFAIFANAENTVEMIDTPDKTWDVAVHPDGTRAYITSFANNNISVIDAQTNQVVDIVKGFNFPQGIAVHPNGDSYYVADRGTGSIAVVDADTNEITSRISDGLPWNDAHPEDVFVHPNGRWLYVSYYRTDTVSVIDTETNTVSATMRMAGGSVGEKMIAGCKSPYDVGDIDQDGMLSAADIDTLTQAIIDGSAESMFDLNDDGIVDQEDRRVWIEDLKSTFFGDANLDGQVNSTDLNALALNWRSTDVNSWAFGDFNGDRTVNAADLNDLALNWQSGGAAASGAAAVPEPTGILLFGLALLGLCVRRNEIPRHFGGGIN